MEPNARKYNSYAFLIALIFFICYSFIAVGFLNNFIPTSPDENQTLFFSKLLAENGTLSYNNELNKKYFPNIFAPRNYVQEGERTVPGGFLGHYIISGLFYSIHPTLIFLISPFAGALSLLVIYKIINLISTKRVSLFITILISVFPPFLFWSVLFYNNMIQFLFLLLSIYYFLRLAENKFDSLISFVLFSIFASLAVWMRYVDIIFILLIFLSAFIIIRKINLLFVMYGVGICIILFIPLLYSNAVLYGSIKTAGPFSKNLFSYNFLQSEISKQLIPFIPFRNFDFMVSTIKVYMIKMFGIFLIFIPLGVLSYIREKRQEKYIYCISTYNKDEISD